MSRRSIFTDDQLARMFAWRRNNKSYGFIARRMACSISGVRYQCLLAGVTPIGVAPRVSSFPMRTTRSDGVPIRRFTPQDDEILLAMDAGDKTNHEMATVLDRAPGTIRHRLLLLTLRQLQGEPA